jgi:hypothetical protein
MHAEIGEGGMKELYFVYAKSMKHKKTCRFTVPPAVALLNY